MNKEDLEIIADVAFDTAYLAHALVQILINKGIITKEEIKVEATKVKMEAESKQNNDEKIN